MNLNPYLMFNGTCEAAFHFYEKTLGGTDLVLSKFGDSPMAANMPADWHDKVVHANMKVAGTILMGSDAPPPHFAKPQGVSMALAIDEPDEAERIFNALSEKGKVNMPLQKTYWAGRFGMLEDQFGIAWMVNCEKGD